uniref:Uncharacterized protein n=1 Tax=Thuricola similis TaxID=2784598 RepID=A0A7T8G5E3_9CILI|nr:hypothetical protein K4Z05_mgp05 [Thuricola similis]QQP22158.1 hypothetical protein TSIM_52 [Thuricola similis]
MTQKTLPQLNRLYTSMISYDPILSNKFFGRSTQIYFFFLYFFQSFYRCLYMYDPLLWRVEYTYTYFWESAESAYEHFVTQAWRNFSLMWKYYYLIYDYKTFFWWSNVYIYTHKNILYIWSTYWQLWPKQKSKNLLVKKIEKFEYSYNNKFNFVNLWLF